jgi:uncharacterized protein YdaU (DUF1376 family)
MAGKPKINYVQLEPASFLSDEDFQMMSDAERGIYCTIIFYMFCNNGRIRNDPQAIQRLCNVTSDFEQKWESVIPKLYQKGVWLRHRRVDFEIKKAREKIQTAIKAGLKGAEKRWGGHKLRQGFPIANEDNETKRNKDNNIRNESVNNSARGNEQPSSASIRNFKGATLRFADAKTT